MCGVVVTDVLHLGLPSRLRKSCVCNLLLFPVLPKKPLENIAGKGVFHHMKYVSRLL